MGKYCHKNAVQNNNLLISIKSFQRVGTTVTNQNYE